MAKEVINSTAVCNQLELVCSDPLQSEVETRKSGKGEKLEIFSCQRKINWLNLPLSTKLSSRHILCFPASHAGCRKRMVWGLSIFPHQNLNLPNNMFAAEATGREQRKQLVWDWGCWKPPAWKRACTHFLIFYSCEKNIHCHWNFQLTHPVVSLLAKRVRESTCSLSLNMVVKSWVLSRKTWLKQ